MSPTDKILSFRCFLKRIFDLVFSFAGILIFFPFFIILAVVIKISSKGKVLHIQERYGKDGKIFKLLKFKTMYKDADERMKQYLIKRPQQKKEWDTYKKLRTFDPRVTPVGKMLRRFSMDELPQLFNVLKGDMSLIGPRPYMIQEKSEIMPYSSVLFKVKPGITGIWQIRGRSELSFESRIKIDMFYVNNWSLSKDIVILFKTVGVVLKGRGAY
jgi:undecaprenyl-phosphate galactose phosphotransferase